MTPYEAQYELAAEAGRGPQYLRNTLAFLQSAWRWLEGKRTQQMASRRMKVAETLSLGEKRFVSILKVRWCAVPYRQFGERRSIACGARSNAGGGGAMTSSLMMILFAAPLTASAGANGLQMGGSSAPWSIVVLLTFLSLIPSILLCVTPFARLLIVFHFLRQALGLQTTPSNQTLIGLSMIMTFFLMQPVAAVIYDTSVVPLEAGTITPIQALERAATPMRQFMAHYVREKDVALFLELAKEPRPRNVQDLSFRVMLPSYILSELKAGFQIGTVLFLPFLVVDMVVASITTSVGMMQLPPVVISTPLKLLLFLMVDGWHLLIGSLMRSFQ